MESTPAIMNLSTTTQLDRIMAGTLLAVRDRKASANLPLLEQRAAAHVPRGFAAGLRSAAKKGAAVIAELKKASPSKGVLREDYRPVEIATSYASAGAAAISVLTDEAFFKGSLGDLEEVSAAVKIPVLRKDFILDSFQILEARAAGADAILLIVAAHTDEALREFNDAAQGMGLDVLCEVHDAQELRRAVDLGCQTIGVNCRNLKTLEVNLRLHEELVGLMPANVLRVAESGIRTPEDIERLLKAGYDAFLVGEALMRQPDPAATLALLVGRLEL
jgi:indole-3-glycerol phosphate synthase